MRRAYSGAPLSMRGSSYLLWFDAVLVQACTRELRGALLIPRAETTKLEPKN